MNFDHEELMLMMLYNTGTRLGLIHELRLMQCYLMPDETTEEKDGTTVNVNYCLYDNGSKTDENNNTFEELVLEKVYPDGGYETELVDFYLVNPETLEVIDEQKSSW